MNRAQRRADARTHRRTARTATALGSAAVLASAGAGAAIVLTQSAASANAPIVVDSLTDDGSGGTTLREAINQANTDSGQDEITFSVTGTITLASNLPVITDAVHITGPGAGSLTIDGGGNYAAFVFDHIDAVDGSDAVTDLTVTHAVANTAYDEGTGGAVMKFYGDADLTIDGVVFTDNYAPNDGGAIALYSTTGHVVISNSVLSNNSAAEGGGALYADGGSAPDSGLVITITGTSITGNNAYYNGGGLYIEDAVATIADSTITDNHTTSRDSNGGGVYADEVDLTITGSTFSDNSAIYNGGGLYAADSTVHVAYSTFSDNVAYGGAGITSRGTTSLTIANSTISGNRSYHYGGGLYLRGSGGTQIVNSTISGNTALQAGGIYVGDAAGLAMAASTVTGNHAGVDPGGVPAAPRELPAVDGIQVGGGAVVPAERRTHREDRVGARDAGEGHHARSARPADDPIPAGTIELIGTIVAGNGTLDLSSIHLEQVTVESLGSILGTVRAATVTVNDHGGTQTGVTTAALALGPLADNGGPTPTHALLPGSVAIDAGPAATDLPSFDGSGYDQRGEPYARIANGRVDVGAFEVQVESPPEPTFTG